MSTDFRAIADDLTGVDQRPTPETTANGFLRSLRPRFSRDINLGHILQTLTVLATITGGAVGCYTALRHDLDSQRADMREAIATQRADLREAVATLNGAIEARHSDVAVSVTAIDGRVTGVEHTLDLLRTEQHDFAAEMRSTLDKLSDRLSDLRERAGRAR